ncbi:MAG: hypothetical protein JW829_11680, partial [Pirellulales bacterium]|nr:hypothetical protein [Pirellulales bacterium]
CPPVRQLFLGRELRGGGYMGDILFTPQSILLVWCPFAPSPVIHTKSSTLLIGPPFFATGPV